jgi:indole-3-glycerol phosphate synthase
MAMHLDEILAVTRRDLERRKQSANLADLEQRAAAHIPRGFAAALRRHGKSHPAIIAELKKASPSRGLIRADFPVASLATSMAKAGAVALSILTEEHYFQGSLANLQAASAAVTIPCLRKDFIVDEFQILEARAASADAILLIAAGLDDAALEHLTKAAHALQLDVLCEVHNAEELSRVLDLGCDAIGVNNRNLQTFEVRLETSLELAPRLPSASLRVAESGIRIAADIARLRSAGFDAFLVGESLMRQPDPAQALMHLLSVPAAPAEVPA